eukprot:m.5453 g.5453  ORF g.5453 m.5453 type:complete len:492 (+) comp7686_c0_seq1:111-1586(+)
MATELPSCKATASYSIVIIGAGSGGLTAADFAIKLGASTCLVEGHRLGGDCSWTGCVPSKALIKVAKAAYHTRHAADYGIMGVPDAGAVKADMNKVCDYVQNTIQKVYSHETPEVLRAKGCQVEMGYATFVNPKMLKINPSDGADPFYIEADHVLICTGAKPRLPEFIKTSTVPYLTYETVFELRELPDHLIVLGGGPIGCELAQAFRRLGAAVTIISRTLMPKEDQDAIDVIAQVFESEGIIHLKERSAAVEAVEFNGSQGVQITTASGVTVQGSHLLVSTGRVPVTDTLNLDAAGIKASPAGIEVNDYLHTSASHIYAAGDCIGGQQFTHLAGTQAFTAVRNMSLPSKDKGLSPLVPRATFTDPEVASVGLTEAEFRTKFGDKGVVMTRSLELVDRAVCENEEGQGFVKLMYDDHYTLHGATVVCQRAGELINELAVCIHHGIKVTKLARVMHAYPSFAFALQTMAADVTVDSLFQGITGKLVNWFKKV